MFNNWNENTAFSKAFQPSDMAMKIRLFHLKIVSRLSLQLLDWTWETTSSEISDKLI